MKNVNFETTFQSLREILYRRHFANQRQAINSSNDVITMFMDNNNVMTEKILKIMEEAVVLRKDDDTLSIINERLDDIKEYSKLLINKID